MSSSSATTTAAVAAKRVVTALVKLMPVDVQNAHYMDACKHHSQEECTISKQLAIHCYDMLNAIEKRNFQSDVASQYLILIPVVLLCILKCSSTHLFLCNDIASHPVCVGIQNFTSNQRANELWVHLFRCISPLCTKCMNNNNFRSDGQLTMATTTRTQGSPPRTIFVRAASALSSTSRGSTGSTQSDRDSSTIETATTATYASLSSDEENHSSSCCGVGGSHHHITTTTIQHQQQQFNKNNNTLPSSGSVSIITQQQKVKVYE
jgi:hypothetical protein